jgi:hypothetical protein
MYTKTRLKDFLDCEIVYFSIKPTKNYFIASKIANFVPEHDNAISRKMKNVKINQFWLTLMG